MAAFVLHANSLYNQALHFAVITHGNQVRKGNEHIPYVFHCVDVANEVIYYSGLPIPELKLAATIAILHDTVEDTFVTVDDLYREFGDEIADGVAAMTKSDSVVSPDRHSKLVELEENMVRLKASPVYVQVVKLADRTSNLKSFPAMWSREKIVQYLKESMLIARVLGDSSEGLDARLRTRIGEWRNMLSIMPE